MNIKRMSKKDLEILYTLTLNALKSVYIDIKIQDEQGDDYSKDFFIRRKNDYIDLLKKINEKKENKK